MPFIIALIFSFAWGKNETQEAQKSIEALIRPLLSQKKTRHLRAKNQEFRIDQCERTSINWMDVLLMRKEVKVQYKFRSGCDIEGTIVPQAFRPFPVVLDLRNLQNFNKVTTQNKITADLAQKPILNLEMREGVLSGKNSNVKFEADYRVQINPMAADPIEKNLGGELRISEIDGKKVTIKEKIFID